MPIKGLTTGPSRPGFIGKLRKGGEGPIKKNNAGKEYKTYGKDLEYFRFDSRFQDVADAFARVYGNEPATIRARLPFASTDENLKAFREEWSAARLIHKCDGEYCYSFDRFGYEVETETPCPYYHLPEEQRKCKPTGRLYLFLPDLIAESARYGLVTLETHSKNDIAHWAQVISDCEQRSFSHDLRGIEFLIYRQPERISTPDGARREKWLVKIEATREWVARQLEASRLKALALPMPATVTIDNETGEVVDDYDYAELDAIAAENRDGPEVDPFQQQTA